MDDDGADDAPSGFNPFSGAKAPPNSNMNQSQFSTTVIQGGGGGKKGGRKRKGGNQGQAVQVKGGFY